MTCSMADQPENRIPIETAIPDFPRTLPTGVKMFVTGVEGVVVGSMVAGLAGAAAGLLISEATFAIYEVGKLVVNGRMWVNPEDARRIRELQGKK